MTWDGRERRQQREDGKEGRRPNDLHCSQHTILWEHHEEDKKNHRGIVCGKITKVEANLLHEVDRLEKADVVLNTKVETLAATIIGKYWFRVVIGFLGIGIGFLYTQNREILSNQHDFVATVQTIEKTQVKTVETLAMFQKEIEALNTRQDVLRNAHMQLMEGLRVGDGRDGRDGKVGRDGRDARK